MYHRELIDELIIPCLIPQYSFIRFFNSMPESPAIDIYVNDELLIASNTYKGITPYFPALAGVYNIQIYLTGTKDTPIIEIKVVQIYQEQIITLVIAGTINNIEIVTVVDDINQTIKPDESMVRIFNLTHNFLTYSIGIIYSGLVSNKGTAYIKMSPGTYTLEVRPPARSHIKAVKVDLNPGKIYTIYILESVRPDSPQYQNANIYQILQVVDGNTILKKCKLY
jgi:hypothetical protein